MKRITRVKNHWRRHLQPNCKEKWCQNVKMVHWTSDQTHVLRTPDRGQSTEKTIYVAQNKGKKKKKPGLKVIVRSQLGLTKTAEVSSLLHTYKCMCAIFTCEIMRGAAGSSDLVAMTTTMTPHPHPNQIYNLHQHRNPRSGTDGLALFGRRGLPPTRFPRKINEARRGLRNRRCLSWRRTLRRRRRSQSGSTMAGRL